VELSPVADVADRVGEQVFRHEVDRRVLVPRRVDLHPGVERLVTVLDEGEVVLAIINEEVVDRGRAERHAVTVDQRPRRVGGDDVTPLHAADARGGDD
jgi:hypothetical protein